MLGGTQGERGRNSNDGPTPTPNRTPAGWLAPPTVARRDRLGRNQWGQVFHCRIPISFHRLSPHDTALVASHRTTGLQERLKISTINLQVNFIENHPKIRHFHSQISL